MVLNETARLTRVSDGLIGLLNKNSNWNLTGYARVDSGQLTVDS